MSAVIETSTSPIRSDFPLIAHSKDVYLDNAATTQKPEAVLNAVDRYYRTNNANVHRGAHKLSERATIQFEAARSTVKAFINARSEHEIIWTRGTTESINLLANSYAGSQLNTGDEILISRMEHHSNIVPWQLIAQRNKLVLKAVDTLESGELDLEDFERKLNDRTKIVAIVHVSNATGIINPVNKIVELAHKVGAIVVLDGAQAVAHQKVDVTALDCDFYAFSGHKMFAPTGIGVLYGKESLLQKMPPWQGGGEMIESVSIERAIYNQLPYKFEAGTPNISGAIGMAAAIDYLSACDSSVLHRHEQQLLKEASSALLQIEGLRIIGEVASKAPIISFVMNGLHPQDIGTLLDQQGIAVRTGHHCAQPLMHHLGLPGTVRASISPYNSSQDIERFTRALIKVRSFA